MLFPYKYVPHQMEKMQTFIDFIFYEVWCKAPANGEFRHELFDDNAELKELMEVFFYGDTQGGDLFYGHVQRIHGLFAGLNQIQIDQFKKWYQANNDIKRACENDPAIQLVRYKEIMAAYPGIAKQLASFFRKLYDKSFLQLAAVREKVGDIKNHSHQFFTTNNIGKCPFCGITNLKGIHHTRREAYDHYLPKFRYPFNSINFHNLAPACYECNSSYKLSKDPARKNAGRRKAFYPYSTVSYSIEITIDLKKPDIDRLAPADIRLAFGPAAIRDEINTWRDVYGIDERYKAMCCSSDAKDWLELVRILRDTGIQPPTSLAMLKQQTDKAPFANSNFLKIAFLEGCNRVGILSGLGA